MKSGHIKLWNFEGLQIVLFFQTSAQVKLAQKDGNLTDHQLQIFWEVRAVNSTAVWGEDISKNQDMKTLSHFSCGERKSFS